jgi:hypothetical protein
MNVERFRSTGAAVAVAFALAVGASAQTPPASPPLPAQPTTPAPKPQLPAKDVWLIPEVSLEKRQHDGNTAIVKGATGLVILDSGRHRRQQQILQGSSLSASGSAARVSVSSLSAIDPDLRAFKARGGILLGAR